MELTAKNAAKIIGTNNEVLRLNNEIDRLRTDIANLNHQIVGYKAVVSYLEHHLGLKGSQ